jgi:adenosylhomocysteine nucleosidase
LENQIKASNSYIIVSALEDEAIGLEHFAPVVHTGIGKINACIKLYEAILQYQPDLVVNYGTAGGLKDLVGLHKVAHFVQADMDVRALDFPRGVTPLSNEKLPIKQGLVLGTSDSFITNADKQLEGLGVEIDLVDMEAYALMKVCQHHGVKFEAYKFISDSANEEAGSQWQKQVKSGTQLFADMISKEYGVSCLKKLP